MSTIGKQYFEQGVDFQEKKDYTNAMYYFKQAKAKGYLPAYSKIGSMYYNGHGVTRSYQEAYLTWLDGDRLDCRVCTGNIGKMYYKGVYLQKDIKKAETMFIQSSEDNADAAYYLGCMRSKEATDNKGRFLAIIYFERAIKLGRTDAYLHVGNLHFEMENYKEAYNFYIDDESPESYYNLGLMYKNGYYVDVNLDKALTMFEEYQSHNPKDKDVLKQIDDCIKLGAKRGASKAPVTPTTVEPSKPEVVAEPETRGESVEELIAELNGMIGLDSVKHRVENLVAEISIRKVRESMGVKVQAKSNHMIFTGNAGTGKTVVARLIAKIFYELGVTKNQNFVECTRADLVASYVGQTATKTNEVIDGAIGGVMFLDEAYTLNSGGESDFGQECIATILKRMEDERDNLIVIMAGYEKEMGELMLSNQGLESRFSRTMNFDDYSDDELTEIFYKFCTDNSYIIDESLRPEVVNLIDKVRESKICFANARDVRNTYERVTEALDMRIYRMGLNGLDKKTVLTITSQDLESVLSAL